MVSTDCRRSGSTSWVHELGLRISDSNKFKDFKGFQIIQQLFLKLWVHQLGPRAGATRFKAAHAFTCPKGMIYMEDPYSQSV